MVKTRLEVVKEIRLILVAIFTSVFIGAGALSILVLLVHIVSGGLDLDKFIYLGGAICLGALGLIWFKYELKRSKRFAGTQVLFNGKVVAHDQDFALWATEFYVIQVTYQDGNTSQYGTTSIERRGNIIRMQTLNREPFYISPEWIEGIIITSFVDLVPTHVNSNKQAKASHVPGYVGSMAFNKNMKPANV